MKQVASDAVKFGRQVMSDMFNTYHEEVELHRGALQCFALGLAAFAALMVSAHVWMALAAAFPMLALPLKLMSYQAGAAGIFCLAWWTIAALDNLPHAKRSR